jgi:hypothetical protein
VARVVAALVARDDIRLRRKEIGDLPLAFVPPLGTDDDRDWHVGRAKAEALDEGSPAFEISLQACGDRSPRAPTAWFLRPCSVRLRVRKVRRVVSYACTRCFRLFPTSASARQHHDATHPAAREKARPGRKRSTQTGRILEAIGGGARTAEAVAKKTRIPLTRVHSLLSYHRRKGNIRGFTGDLRLVK